MQKRMSKNSSKPLGTIRVIGGRWRGRKLPVLDAEGLRPTTDRLKETVFNWIQFEITGAQVLDAFAGTGSLGIEALSRGAASAIFVENNRAAVNQLKTNLNTLKALQCEVQEMDTLRYLQTQSTRQFDLVFIDPPFHQQLAQPTINALEANQWLTREALIYVETEINAPVAAPSNWQLTKEKTTSQVRAQLFLRTESEL
ncbi:MAG: 16S rRNA (guanine(966)-N(2))-methyltransferase RsmD [Idiomarinaceae bacterium HL-53]|nr:MAG: 16S rRNA (guanine(966)-N(2))-methyltransferase RsmD [Idiomarinaceae bacterium HL-53]CUS47626.1 16S rRNA (guanine966-N2)-methyltransferase [Idiomarinaceae bacterium HL-53]